MDNVAVLFLTVNGGPSTAMQVVKLHKRRLLAVAMSFLVTFVLVLLAVVATVQQEEQHTSNDTMWRYGYGVQPSANETPVMSVVVVDDNAEPYGYTESQDEILGEYDDGNDDEGDGDYENDGSDGDVDDEDEDAGDEEDDEDNENEVFRDGDFDSLDRNSTQSTTTATTLDVRATNFVMDSRVGDRKLHSQFADSRVKRGATARPVEDFILWSRELERLAPKGLSDNHVTYVQKRTRQLKVARLTPPTWNRCGRANNQFVTFEDGSHACARHRSPHDHLVQGEVLSFYLARLLGIHNVPTVVLSRVNPDSDQWSSGGSSMLAEAQWDRNTTVALIQWIDGLQRERMPAAVFNALKTGRPISLKTKGLAHGSTDLLTELLQWSDLVVFDYITGNYDRVASMQDAAEKERRPDIFERDTIHNLAVSRSSRQWRGIWLIDNESGLLDTYSLMYDEGQGSRFVAFHNRMLRTFCVFRRSTRDRIASLLRPTNASDTLDILLGRVRSDEPLFDSLSDVTGISNYHFAKRFRQRVTDVYDWMNICHNVMMSS